MSYYDYWVSAAPDLLTHYKWNSNIELNKCMYLDMKNGHIDTKQQIASGKNNGYKIHE